MNEILGTIAIGLLVSLLAAGVVVAIILLIRAGIFLIKAASSEIFETEDLEDLRYRVEKLERSIKEKK